MMPKYSHAELNYIKLIGLAIRNYIRDNPTTSEQECRSYLCTVNKYFESDGGIFSEVYPKLYKTCFTVYGTQNRD